MDDSRDSAPKTTSAAIQPYSSLFNMNEKPDGMTFTQKIALGTGVVIVAASMAPQAGLGALACDVLVKNDFTPVLRYGSDIAVGLSSGAGKFAIVLYYGIDGYVALGSIKGWAELGEKLFSLQSLSLFALSIPASLTFPYLNKISLVNSGVLLNQLHLQEVTKIINSAPSQILCMSTSGVGNLMAFSGIIYYAGYQNIKKMVYFAAENPEYRKIVAAESRELEKVRNYFKALVEAEELDKADKFLGTIFDKREKKVSEIRTAMLTQGINQQIRFPLSEEETWTMFLSKAGLGVLSAGVSIWGLSNFYDIGKQGLLFYIMGRIPIPSDEYSTVVSVIADIWGGVVYGSMMAMALPTYYIPGDLIDWCNNQRTALAPYSKAIIYTSAVLALVAGIIGGAPNLYQSFYTGQEIFTNIASVLSSNNIELPALYILLVKAIRWMIDMVYAIKDQCCSQTDEEKLSDFQIRLFEMADGMLREATNLENLSAEEIQALYKEHQLIQTQKSDKGKDLKNAGVSATAGKDSLVVVFDEPDINPDATRLPSQYRSGLVRAWNCASGFWSNREKAPLNVQHSTYDMVENNPEESKYCGSCIIS